MPSPPGTWATPRRAISSGGRWVMSRPSKTMAPWSASTTPPMARSRVDLPAPLVPSSATISPSPISIADVAEHRHAVVADGEVARRRAAGSLPARRSTSISARVRMDVQTFAHVARDQAARAGHDQPADGEDGHQDEQAVAEPDGVADRADHREDEEPGQDEEGADGEADRAHPGRDGERERRPARPGPTMASDASMPALPMKATGTLGASANSTAKPAATTEATASMRNTRPMSRAASRVAMVAPTARPEQVEDLDRRDEEGALDRVEVEGLLVLQRGQRGEAGDGGGQEGQGEEDAAQHADLPHRAPGLAERGRGLDRDVDRRRRAPGAGASPSGDGLAPLGDQHLLGQLDLLVAAPRRARAGAAPTARRRRWARRRRRTACASDQTAASPAPSSTPTMAPMLMPERWAEYIRGRAGTG